MISETIPYDLSISGPNGVEKIIGNIVVVQIEKKD
jgi:hypothetical protein